MTRPFAASVDFGIRPRNSQHPTLQREEPVKPGEVPTELAETLDRYVVLPKFAMSGRPNLSATEVISEVQRRTGHRFNSIQHAEAARQLGARPPRGEDDRTTNLRFAEYITSFKRYLYSQAWIDELVKDLQDPKNFERIVGTPPRPTGA